VIPSVRLRGEEVMKSKDTRTSDPIRIVVATNSYIHGQVLSEFLKRDEMLCIAGAAVSSQEFLEVAGRTNANLVVISAQLDDDPKGGMAALRQYKETHPQVPGIITVDSLKSETVLEAFRAGARGIFSEQEPPETLYKCVRVVYQGQIWATSRELRIALEALSSVRTVRAPGAGGLTLLTARELQVVHLLAEGLTNSEIGIRLGLSRHTVKNYLLKIFDKLGVSNRVELLFLSLTHPAQSDVGTRVNTKHGLNC